MATQMTLAPAELEQVNILLVDDQPGKLLTYEAILKDLGQNLVKASSASEALRHLLKTEFAVILVDVCMPEQDGFELVEMIREHHRLQQTAIIFVSAIQLTDLDQMKGYASGAVDYVSVPVVPAILRAKVAIFVDLYRKTRELARLNEDLERRVQERTAALQKTESKLKEANRRKDEFLAMLAHELRNPLAPLQNSLELLRMAKGEDPLLNNIEDIVGRQLAQMTRLIDDLMDVSRITRNQLELRIVETTLDSILANAIESTKPGIDAAGQLLHLTVPSGPIRLQADPARLAQVLANLLNNAGKYTPPAGEIWFDIQQGPTTITFSIRDNGIGIDAADLPKVFEPFHQVSNSIERAKGGLGIGLTLVRTIVEGHKGTIEAHSPGIGQGSEFVVTIPNPAPLWMDKAAAPEAKVDQKQTVWRVLVVDDNVDAAQTLAMLLKHIGHSVQTAYDGREAIEYAQEFRPDVVFMDVGMPEMNGYEAAQAIKSQDWGRAMVLVAVTGWGQKEDRDKTAKAGFDHHLVKPAGFDDIEKVLSRLSPPA